MKFLFSGTFGSENPTRATLTFLQAKAAHEAGHEVKIALTGDSVVLFNPAVAKNVQGMGLPSFPELVASVKEAGIPVYGWGLCCDARGVSEELVKALGGERITPPVLIEMYAEADHAITH